ncbi:MAG: hypothetical protein RIG77_06415 [Cyclobacteriaceae bacterium]
MISVQFDRESVAEKGLFFLQTFAPRSGAFVMSCMHALNIEALDLSKKPGLFTDRLLYPELILTKV